MKKKILGIFVMTLLIAAALPSISGSVIKKTNYIDIQNSEIFPNDPEFDKQWALHNTGQNGGTPDADIDAPEAWDLETGSPEIVIAILDSGVDWDHPDLADNIWINIDEEVDGSDTDGNGYIDDIRGWDFINDDNDPMDDLFHGTLCAGIAGAVTDNNIGIAGVCWNCKIMAVKVINETGWETDEAAANGIIYAADNGADVISISWGGLPSYPLTEDAINYAYSQGVILFAAAGNSNTDVKFYPAAFDNVSAVAATDRNDKKVFNSNHGSWVDIAAPGLSIYTTKLDDSYGFFSFTSAATPHVAGLAGLILSRNPTLSPEEVRSIIKENVDPYDSEYYLGTGRINAYKALNASNRPPDKPTITGETNGKIGEEYEYTFRAVDPDDNDVKYYIDWDDGDPEETGFNPSGEDVKLKNTWYSEGTYTITAYAEDEYDLAGPEGELTVVITKKTRAINTPFQRFLQQYLNLFPLLQKILLLRR